MSQGAGALTGRRILITGAASGIGRATAILFAAEGARVALVDQDAKGLAEVAAATKGLPFELDVTRDAEVEASIAKAAAQLDGLDGIVNAAGIAYRAGLAEATPERWRRVIEVNLTGPYLICRTALPYLQAAPMATIVNIASGLGLRATAGRIAYTASKAGLVAFTRSIARELGPAIRVNALCPGAVDTPMIRASTRGDPAALAASAAHYALQRLGTPEEIADAALFLTDARSSFVTGAILMADGGA